MGTGLALGAVADALVWVPVVLAKSATFLAGLFAGIPHAAIAVAPTWWLGPVLYGAACVLYARWERVSPRRLAALLGVVCSLAAFGVARWTLFASPSVTVLDVGQGDAILLRHGSHAVLVDAGVDEASCCDTGPMRCSSTPAWTRRRERPSPATACSGSTRWW